MSEFELVTNNKPMISPQEMWAVMNTDGNPNWGIPGYESPKIYFDHVKQKKDRAIYEMHGEVWNNRGHYPKPKFSLDKDGKEIIPQKLNFIDECIKQSNSCFSKSKFDNYVNFIKDKKGKTLDEVEGIIKPKVELNKDQKKAKIYRHDRSTTIDEIFINEKKKTTYAPLVQELIDKTKERQAKYASPLKDVATKYKGKTSLTKSDKISFISDAQWLSERTPFYNTKPENGEGSDGDNKKDKKETKLFNPDKIRVMNRSPQWKISKPVVVNKDYMDKREDQMNEKINNLKKSWDDRRIKFIDDVSVSYFKLKDGTKGGFKYTKVN